MPKHESASGAVSKVTRESSRGIESRLEGWLKENLSGFERCRVGNFSSSAAGGLSGETLIVPLEQAPVSAVVVKLEVLEAATNPQTSFNTLLTLQKVLGDIDTLPVPRLLGAESSPEVLGAPFAIMEFVSGQIPSDIPPYAASGWVREATAEQRAQMWDSGLDFLVQLHQLDWQALALQHLQFDAPGDDHLERCLNFSVQLFRGESNGRSSAICEEAIAWLRSHRPEPARECLNWGDARIGNIIWQNFECAAAIDWEMGCLGYPGIDLGWWSFFHRWSTFGQNNPALEGMCVGQELADLYHARGGDRIEQFVYYELLAAIRGLSIWLRMFDAMKAQGAFGDLDPLGDEIHMVKVVDALMREAR